MKKKTRFHKNDKIIACLERIAYQTYHGALDFETYREMVLYSEEVRRLILQNKEAEYADAGRDALSDDDEGWEEDTLSVPEGDGRSLGSQADGL